jgi:hypothetical protein
MTDLRFEHKPGGASASARDALDPIAAFKAQIDTLQASHEEVFDLPGHPGYAVKYKRLLPDEYREPLMSGKPSLTRNAEFLMKACVGLYQRVGDDLEPLWPAGQEIRPSEAPLYGDMNGIMDMGLDDAVDVVLAVFGGHGIQLEEHSDLVFHWMRSIEEPEHEALVGGQPVTR